MIKICDAVMGSGKSTACINYMNAHPRQRFIYISPYLEEDERIWAACKSLHFIRPNTINEEDNHTKFMHTKRLLKSGRNICTTHQLFRRYDDEMLEDIRKHRYTLICDEVVDAIETAEFSSQDIKLLLDSGFLKAQEGSIVRGDTAYSGTMLRGVMKMFDERKYYYADVDGERTIFTWILPPQLLYAFRDVYILTYMFAGQNMKYMMDMYNMKYTYIGVRKNMLGEYEFCDADDASPAPAYFADIHSLIRIHYDDRMNSIGDDRTALSKNWLDTHPEEMDTLRKNLQYWFRFVNPESRAGDRMWGCMKDYERMLSGKGYSSSYVVFNKRASNSLRGKTCLAYVTNVYMNVTQKIFLKSRGVEVSDDAYALSTMIQWIWRSAIRDGKPISIYVPSRRMRELLVSWMDSIAEQAGASSREKLPNSIVIDLPDDGSTEIMVPFRLEGCRVIPG